VEDGMGVSGWSSCVFLAIAGLTVSPQVSARKEPPVADNAELTRMHREDQDDRKAGVHGIDWTVVKPRDDARLKRTRELHAAGALRTGPDWYHAAMILQHGNEADDFLLAHEMCVAAIALGEPRARWLAAASEDRFLRRIGRNQRFGTQYEPEGEPPNLRFRLAPADADVTDALRAALDAPSLAEAKERESLFNQKK
jgi:hypothetical protein